MSGLKINSCNSAGNDSIQSARRKEKLDSLQEVRKQTKMRIEFGKKTLRTNEERVTATRVHQRTKTPIFNVNRLEENRQRRSDLQRRVQNK